MISKISKLWNAFLDLLAYLFIWAAYKFTWKCKHEAIAYNYHNEGESKFHKPRKPARRAATKKKK